MYTIAALYHFTRFEDPGLIRPHLLDFCLALGVTGTLLLAREGINGTIAGEKDAIDAVLGYLKNLPGCSALEHKESHAKEQPFAQMKVRLKKEIVTMGQPNVDPTHSVGTYVPASDWNALIASPDVVVIDTRNDYEVAIGSFEGALDPKTSSFREFPAWWERNKGAFEGKKVAMFCTGGIRCEKSTNWLKQQGVEDVFHLHGGILKYLEEVPQEESRWNGSCFVFDGRVSVEHGLVEGPHLLCHACRRPILPKDRQKPTYEHGVSCHLCIDETSSSDKERFRERQKQIELARERGEKHMGGERGV
ncbi:oxygen-dependent tRNA uridine(34) hydroxylase TrhO [Roseobacteraceae bacterium S113]